jgi:hypothetical protein
MFKKFMEYVKIYSWYEALLFFKWLPKK